MKKVITLFILFISASVTAQTQDSSKAWIKGGAGALNFSQSSFTNWAAGGENSISGIAMLNLYANYKKNKTTWDNSLDMAYGMVQTGKTALLKNEDKIDLVSKYGHTTSLEHWYYSALVNFKTQFDEGYNLPDNSTLISHFMAPAYVLAALGMDYRSTDKSFTATISPLTSKTTIVNNQRLADQGAYGVKSARYDSVAGVYVMVEHGSLYRSEFGGFIKLLYKKDVIKNVNVSTKLELFSNYLEHPDHIDVNWELMVAMKVNKFLTTTISTQMIYDHDIPVPVVRQIDGVDIPGTGPRLQFKEVLGVGITYKF